MNSKTKLKIGLILAKYEKLGLTSSSIYMQLKTYLENSVWLSKLEQTLGKVKGSEKIFDISKEINSKKNDQRVLEMFSEFDVADRLVNTKFFGDFYEVEYLESDKKTRRPDFLAKNNTDIIPVEVKLLSPQGLSERKFFQKLIDKVNDQALQQLKSQYEKEPFQNGIVFVFTHSPIPLGKITYNDLDKYFKEKVEKPVFNVTIVCILYGYGLWDFYLS